MSFEAAIHPPDTHRRERLSRGAIWAVLGAALTAGALVRYWDIGTRALWLDEAYSAWFSALGWSALWFDIPRYETHPPLYYSMLKAWRGVAGDGPAALRSLSAAAGLLAIPVAAAAAIALAKLVRTRRPILMLGAVCAAMALSPRLLVIAQEARPYPLLLLAYALAVTCWLRLTWSFRSGEAPHGRLGDWIGLGIGTLLTLWLHFVGLLYGAALFAALMLTAAPGATRQRWLRLGATVGLTAVAYLPCLLMLLGRSGDWNSGWVAWDPLRFPGALLDLYGFHAHDEPVTPIAARIVFALLIAAALRGLWRAGERPLTLGLGTLILLPPVAAAILSQVGHPVFVPRTLVAVLAPAYLAAAFALAALPEKRAHLLGGAAALIMLVNLGQAIGRPSQEPWDEVAAALQRRMAPGDVVWAYPNDTALPLEQALGRAVQPLPARFPALHAAGTRPAGSPAVVAMDGAAASAWAARQPVPPRATVWLVMRAEGLFDPEGAVSEGLARGRKAGPAQKWTETRLQPLHPR